MLELEAGTRDRPVVRLGRRYRDVHLATKLPDLQDLAFLHFGPAPSLSPEKAGATMAQDLMQFLQDPRIDELGDLAGTDLAKRWS